LRSPAFTFYLLHFTALHLHVPHTVYVSHVTVHFVCSVPTHTRTAAAFSRLPVYTFLEHTVRFLTTFSRLRLLVLTIFAKTLLHFRSDGCSGSVLPLLPTRSRTYGLRLPVGLVDFAPVYVFFGFSFRFLPP